MALHIILAILSILVFILKTMTFVSSITSDLGFRKLFGYSVVKRFLEGKSIHRMISQRTNVIVLARDGEILNYINGVKKE